METNTVKVNDKAAVAAIRGAVIIRTDDGSHVVLTPRLALDLAAQLPGMAYLAEDKPILAPDWMQPKAS